LCAAFCNIAACEKEPELARRINVDGPAALARALTREGAFVVFPSTSLVFDGLFPFSPPDAPVRPATLYARLKAEAERELLALGAVSVVRLSKVIGPATALFAGWVSELRAGKPVFPFDDMMMAPISGTLAVEVMLRAAERRAQGVLHLSARRDVSYAEAARHIAERLGAPPSLVQPRSRLAAGIPDAAAPRHTALDCRRTARELDLPPPDPFDALEEFLQEEPWKTTAPATR
jgi:dTDP-4-dehydrorhamnose reductase